MNTRISLHVIMMIILGTSATVMYSGHMVQAQNTVALSGERAYVVWLSNDTGNREVLFRASNDSGATFGDVVNLSNSNSSDSTNVELTAAGDNVFVKWWERNGTSSEPVARISNQGGIDRSFGPVLMLANNRPNG